MSPSLGGGAIDRIRIDRINGESIVVGTDVKQVSCRTKLFGGEKEQLLQVLVNVGTELERARDRATS
jgi:hypothetical protein